MRHGRKLLLLAMMAAGCRSATPRYALVAPGDAAGPLGEATRRVARDGIEFEVSTLEDRVAIRFANGTGKPIRLVEGSATIDARGRAFAVEPQSIPPGAAGRVLVPPTFGAARLGERRPIAGETRVGPIDDGGIARRRDDRAYEPTPSERFEWGASQTARVVLRFELADKIVEQQVTLRRE